MRRFLLPALMISLLLTGCGAGDAEERLKAQREAFAAAEEITFSAEVTADLGGEIFVCSVDCTYTPKTMTVEITAPESVAGVRTSIEDGKTVLEYGGLSLGVGADAAGGLSPVGGLRLLTEALRGGFLQRCWTETDGERELIAAELFVDDDTALTVWYTEADVIPVHCEFSRGGQVLLRCELREFTFR